MVVLEEKSEGHSIHHLLTIKVCTKINGNPINTWEDLSVWTKVVDWLTNQHYQPNRHATTVAKSSVIQLLGATYHKLYVIHIFFLLGFRLDHLAALSSMSMFFLSSQNHNLLAYHFQLDHWCCAWRNCERTSLSALTPARQNIVS